MDAGQQPHRGEIGTCVRPAGRPARCPQQSFSAASSPSSPLASNPGIVDLVSLPYVIHSLLDHTQRHGGAVCKESRRTWPGEPDSLEEPDPTASSPDAWRAAAVGLGWTRRPRTAPQSGVTPASRGTNGPRFGGVLVSAMPRFSEGAGASVDVLPEQRPRPVVGMVDPNRAIRGGCRTRCDVSGGLTV